MNKINPPSILSDPAASSHCSPLLLLSTGERVFRPLHMQCLMTGIEYSVRVGL